ncbi:MAG: T9SS type A sorting domain-containing protein [Pedobacter sp.]|uniref:T9SS type A sorting domain-containing protein n=1 Tax=Pedobacter sp. TaxID=1411316 RepID=UPI002807FA65|nr:T9SS type A sorting domain-containing protein [Pedobacter sp.]MDQ8004811.1 T9SS type A sorting domain-containing protein [Pedobacter sp.]
MKKLLLIGLIAANAFFVKAQSNTAFTYRGTIEAAANSSSLASANSAYGVSEGIYGNTLFATDNNVYTSIRNTFSLVTGNKYLGILNKINIDNTNKTIALSAQVALPNVNNTDLSVAFANKKAPARDFEIVKNGNYEYYLTASSYNKQVSYSPINSFTQSLSASPIDILSATTNVILPPPIANIGTNNPATFQFDNFGKKIAVSGNKVAIAGNIYQSASPYNKYGFVAIYTLNADGTFSTPTASDVIISFLNETYFGDNIHFDGDDLFIQSNSTSNRRGEVIRFRKMDTNGQFSSSGTWRGLQNYRANTHTTPLFGTQIITTPTSIFINSPENNRLLCYKRELVVGEYNTNPSYYNGIEVSAHAQTLASVYSNGKFSTSVAKRGNVIAIGNPESTVGGYTNAGAVHLYTTKMDNGIEVIDATTAKFLISNEPSTDAKFGSSIAFSPTQNNIFVAKESFVGTALTSPGAIEYFTFDSTLPVALTNYTVTNVNHKAVISWSTSTETNNSYFILERSTDGINFIEIAKIASKGNNSEYTFTDHTPALGSNYYRLMQFDLDGKNEDLGIKPVTIKSLSATEISVYPNPVTNVLNINGNGHQLRLITIYNISGKKVIDIKPNNKTAVSINVNDLSKGVYLVKVSGENIAHSTKIIK